MKVLVTGGTGYIGSHATVELINQGHEVTIVDNLINSKKAVLDQIAKLTNTRPKFCHVDLTDQAATSQIFQENHFELVIHFAGLKAVAESVEKPLLYYHNNLTSTINLLKIMQTSQVNNFIFSSSATVYGNPGTPKYTEDLPTGQNISSPYGKTKYIIEEIMKDVAASNPHFCAIALRYFNPIGNHPSGLLGEDPNGIPNNLMPIVTKVYRDQTPAKLSVYGHDYPTPDGTCRRDYIHVVDLAKGHLAAISALTPGFKAYNLGTGQPTSVLEIIQAFEKISGQALPHKFAPRRPGDLSEFWADPTKATKELNWHAELTIDNAIRDTLTFVNQN